MPGRVPNPPWSVLLAAGLVVVGSSGARAQQPPPAPAAPAAEPSAREVVRQANQGDAATPGNDPVEKIKEEADKRSQVMETLSYLTDVIGPRLTASPAAKRANEWTRDKLASWGLENAKLEPWGDFGRGWTLQKFSIQVVEPQCIPLIAFPRAWSPGTDGPVTGPVVDFDSIKTEADLMKLKGTLKGAFVLLGPPREAKAHFEPEATRLTDSDLLGLANLPDVNTRRARRTPPPPAPGTPAANAPANTPAPPTGGPGGRFTMSPEQRAAAQLQRRKTTFAMEEGAAAILDGSAQGDGGTLFVAQASVPTGPMPGSAPDPNARRVSAWDKDAPKILPQVSVSKEHYNRLLRMLRQGEKLTMTLDLAVKFHDGDDAKVYNTVAEIPGTDLKDEVVMLGGHMDSWHSGTGATDNAAGVAVAMEAVRIIKALDLKPRRTIRVALWTGEEQGLYGSRGYVRDHFGQMGNGSPVAEAMGSARMAKLTTKPEYEKFSAYYNLDNGTGKIRGIYLQGNEAARAVFSPWLKPFRDMGASTITISNTSGTDHQSFDGIGLPGFQFIQDEVEYDSRTHHSNQDLYDRIQADDMKQASAVMAAFVLNTANRDEKLPRKPTPNLVPAAPSSTPTPATNPAAATSTRE